MLESEQQATPVVPADPSPDAPAPRGTARWPPWMAFTALVGGIVLATIGSLLVDIPALAFGVNLTASHVPPGLTIADTAVQDAGFIAVAVFFAQLGGRTVEASMFGLRTTRLWRALRLLVGMLVVYFLFSLIWAEVFNTSKEKLLEQLGTNETTTLLVLSAALTCVIAPIAEEFLFRGFIFSALRNWRGTLPAAVITGLLFGGVHVGSAPAIDLLPLAALGFGLCLLYRATGSLYPCIAAHCINNSIAFASLESWVWWKALVLMAAALGVLWLLASTLTRVGVIRPERSPAT
ncbi:MAG TPA: type II CAAX endopeptidase family protein [Solirubrobacteraceae bacterium]|nr:type II CAAX endopeptidase family protein [Solirubrobacteraceae bacterium]